MVEVLDILIFFLLFIELHVLAIEQHILVLFRAGFPCASLDLRVHGPGWDWRSKSRKFYSAFLFF